MNSNTGKDTECDYHLYARDQGLPDAENRCNNSGTKIVDLSTGVAVAICKEHSDKINK